MISRGGVSRRFQKNSRMVLFKELHMRLSGKPLWILFIAFAVIFGSAYNMFLYFDYQDNTDCQTYMAIAKGEFKDQSLVRRYRVIIPFAAKVVSLPIQKVYSKLWPLREATDEGPLRLGFLIVNCLMMSIVGLALYHACLAYGLQAPIALSLMCITLIAGRWGSLFAGTPHTDSLYMLAVTGVLYGLKTNKRWVLIGCLILGPLAKESFLLIIPAVLVFSRPSKIQAAIYCLAGIVVAGIVRYYIDRHTMTPMLASVGEDVATIYRIRDSLIRISSIRGLGELATVFGIFSSVYIIGFVRGMKGIRSWMNHTDPLLWSFVLIAIVHALLSCEVARMLYLFAAPLIIIMGRIVQPIMISANALTTESLVKSD